MDRNKAFSHYSLVIEQWILRVSYIQGTPQVRRRILMVEKVTSKGLRQIISYSCALIVIMRIHLSDCTVEMRVNSYIEA